jgi:plastocyanin
LFGIWPVAKLAGETRYSSGNKIGGEEQMSRTRKWSISVAVILATLSASACSKATSNGAKPGSTATPKGVAGSTAAPQAVQLARSRAVTVTVDASGFQPKEVRTAPGTNVIWVQADGGSHVIVSGAPGHEDGKFKSLAMKKDSSFTIVAQSPGTYQYFDQLHPTLTAQLVVSGTSVSPSSPTSP